MLDKARLAAAGRSLHHDRQARGIRSLEKRDLITLRRIIRLFRNTPIVK